MRPYAFVAALLVFVALSAGAQEIKIGGIGPVTGEAATFGVSTKNGMTLAVEEWNAKGGVLGKKIKLVFADDKGDPAEGATVYTKLIQQDKVVALVGTVMSKVTLAGAPIAQAAKVPMISPTSTNEKVTQVGDYIFRACFIDPFQGTVGAKFAYNDLKARTAACIFDVGNDYTKGLSENFQKAFLALGGKVVAYEAHPTGTTDFKAQLTKIIQAKPDVIYCSDYYNDDALIATQARELGYTGPFVGGDGWDSADLVKIGGAAVENCFFTNHYAPDATTPAVLTFVKNYKARFKTSDAPDALAALGYDAMYIMLDAIKRAGKADGVKIKEALAKTDLAVVSGQVKFDANRNPIKAAAIIEIKGGKQVYRTTVNP
ncbi:MAG TPA: ABC transporter substrate-binding protein [Spirochaetales bacterium]|nr:ABC transporter substrate-binding protein [Spirochaetales bacterium]HRY53749.1 ABC transporter substrate-binding protein [Spirochaetia bacterium]HRZ63678.1 ABC transporter substrate-binding protein [Spirochaetia bacterium]